MESNYEPIEWSTDISPELEGILNLANEISRENLLLRISSDISETGQSMIEEHDRSFREASERVLNIINLATEEHGIKAHEALEKDYNQAFRNNAQRFESSFIKRAESIGYVRVGYEIIWALRATEDIDAPYMPYEAPFLGNSNFAGHLNDMLQLKLPHQEKIIEFTRGMEGRFVAEEIDTELKAPSIARKKLQLYQQDQTAFKLLDNLMEDAKAAYEPRNAISPGISPGDAAVIGMNAAIMRYKQLYNFAIQK